MNLESWVTALEFACDPFVAFFVTNIRFPRGERDTDGLSWTSQYIIAA